MITSGNSFRLLSIKKIENACPEPPFEPELKTENKAEKEIDGMESDDKKRTFLKLAGMVGVGALATTLLPKRADALVFGSSPASNVVGLKNSNNSRINPATDDTLASLIVGQGVTKITVFLSSSGNVYMPTSGKSVRVYATRFSLTANAASVSFRFTSSGTDYEKYASPFAGGLYGSNNHPNYVQGGPNEILYCVISGTTTVQINVDYLEV